jgi:hypothetical protein
MNWRVRYGACLGAAGLGAALAFAATAAHGQAEQKAQPTAPASSSLPAQSELDGAKRAGEAQSAADVNLAVSEIDDPATGDRWILERDPRHPEGPGRMALLAQPRTRPNTRSPAPTRSENPLGGAGAAQAEGAPAAAPVLVIHGGDRLIVEEHTPVADARLEAVALGPAAVGSSFRVRLAIGGRVIVAFATSAGHALLASTSGGPQ